MGQVMNVFIKFRDDMASKPVKHRPQQTEHGHSPVCDSSARYSLLCQGTTEQQQQVQTIYSRLCIFFAFLNSKSDCTSAREKFISTQFFGTAYTGAVCVTPFFGTGSSNTVEENTTFSLAMIRGKIRFNNYFNKLKTLFYTTLASTTYCILHIALYSNNFPTH